MAITKLKITYLFITLSISVKNCLKANFYDKSRPFRRNCHFLKNFKAFRSSNPCSQHLVSQSFHAKTTQSNLKKTSKQSSRDFLKNRFSLNSVESVKKSLKEFIFSKTISFCQAALLRKEFQGFCVDFKDSFFLFHFFVKNKKTLKKSIVSSKLPVNCQLP